MKEYQERVVEEKKELDQKIEKLETFLRSDVFESLKGIEKSLLEIQGSIMKLYSHVLEKRIELFS